MDICKNLDQANRKQIEEILKKEYLEAEQPEEPAVKFEITITLKSDAAPFYVTSRRVSFYERNQVRLIIQDWLTNRIIQKSNSQYCSPTVIVRKKN
ncbi:MAG: hypothetical protein PV347_06080 [Rickettsiaceae bacterium]|nr:hypothetical protein [Rickettsiaceae bacterium]